MPLLRDYYVRNVLISWRSAAEPSLDVSTSHAPDWSVMAHPSSQCCGLTVWAPVSDRSPVTR
jgi:hypothetical protein